MTTDEKLDNRILLDKMLSRGFKFLRIRKDTKVAVDEAWPDNPIVDKDTLWEILDSGKYDLAINCGASGLTAIDVDVKEGKNGRQELEQLEAQYGTLPDTLTHGTPSTGLHYLFSGVTPLGNKKLSTAIDIRATGGYIVAPTSSDYTVLKDLELATLPHWVQTQQRVLSGDKGSVNIEEEVEFGHGDRNNEMTRVAGALRGLGMDPDLLLHNLLEINETRCNPPLDRDEIETIAASVSRYASEEAKAIAKKSQKEKQIQKDFEDYKAKQGACVPKAVSDFVGNPPPRVWLFNDWIPQGEIGSLYGSGGSGKSLLALQLGYAVATGTPWIGLTPTTSMPVLAVCCEDDDHEVHRRVNAFRQEGCKGEDNFRIWSRVGEDNVLVTETKDGKLETSLFYKLLEEYITMMPKGPKLLILDTLADIYMANENDRMLVNMFIKYHLGKLAKKYDCTILMIAHPSRAGMKTKDLLSGTTGWENSVRYRLNFVTHEDNDEIMVLNRAQSNYSKRGEEIYLQWRMGAFGVVEGMSQVSEVAVDVELLNMIDSYSKETCAATDLYNFLKKKGYKRNKKTFFRRLRNSLSECTLFDGRTYKAVKGNMQCEDGKYRSNIIVIEIAGHAGHSGTNENVLQDEYLLK